MPASLFTVNDAVPVIISGVVIKRDVLAGLVYRIRSFGSFTNPSPSVAIMTQLDEKKKTFFSKFLLYFMQHKT